jgi:hypothetical protein
MASRQVAGSHHLLSGEGAASRLAVRRTPSGTANDHRSRVKYLRALPGDQDRAAADSRCLMLAAVDQAGLVAWIMALCMPSAAWWVRRSVALVRPAVVRPSRYSCRDRAPAMQPT